MICRAKDYYYPHIHIESMPRLRCSDYGFECDFVAEGTDAGKVIEEYGKHSTEEHEVEYSKESLIQFIPRPG